MHDINAWLNLKEQLERICFWSRVWGLLALHSDLLLPDIYFVSRIKDLQLFSRVQDNKYKCKSENNWSFLDLSVNGQCHLVLLILLFQEPISNIVGWKIIEMYSSG